MRMPIYEYGCGSCGHTLEALQKLSDRLLKKCPECGKPALKRLMSAPAFRLKGSGWYETDFKSGDEKKRNLAESAADTHKETALSKDDAPKAKVDGKAATPPDKGGAKETKRTAKETKPASKPTGKGTGSEAA
jgi:putative FmdB family regulatory protein